MTALTAALSVGVGIHLALTLFLLLRYLEGRERRIGWWAVSYAFFTAHIVAETLITVVPDGVLYATRHALFIAAAWSMLYSFRPDPRLTLAAAGAILVSAILAPPSWMAGALVASLTGGAAFVASATRLYREEEGLQTASAVLLFWGLLLGGIHALDYPFFRPHPTLAAVGAAVSGVITLTFGIGVVLWALQRSRDLVTMSAVAESLNRSLDVREALGRALRQLVALMRVSSGWIFLRDADEFQLAVSENLPRELASNQMERMRGDCRCLQMLREGQLTQAVNIVNCLRLEKAGYDHPRHVTVPLRTASDVLGVMNLVLPRRRSLTSRELATLSAIGHQIGLAAERARLYEEVREKEALRGRLLEKLISAHEDERRRIARELHDEAGQALTALILNLQVAEQSEKPLPPQQLARLRGIAEDTLAELRRMIYDLRPSILDDLGLAAAIRWYAKETIEPKGVQVTMSISGLNERLPSYIETAVFRIVQEALTNVLKHASATHTTVEVAHRDSRVQMVIFDDGQGFDLSSVSTHREGGMGLLGMRERAELLGGTLTIHSEPGGGTRLEVAIPVGAPDGQD
ncbi:MAG: GAF domain-containing sensor histidine kinase [Armatimonadetes bacterium]|nr:GAF domain-containing sensor histidine kinase [Armatimonadota bacterium]